MEQKEKATEELFIVGSRYGELADEISTLYNLKRPIETKDITQAIGDDVVYLKPVPNDHDQYAVAVFSQDTKRIGFVWMYQAPTMRHWMDIHNQQYIEVRVTDVNKVAKVLMAEINRPFDVQMMPRCCNDIDMRWAHNLPDVLKSISEQSLELGLMLLRDELSKATEWNNRLKMRIDNLLQAIPLDLSAFRHNDYMEVFNMMRHSKINEVREQSDYLLSTLIYRGSKEHVRWWAEEWLPSFFREAAEGDLLGMFESAHYSIDRVEELLDEAPENLFHLYKVNKDRFVNRLYYYALPQEIYNRLLTLLAVREAMLGKVFKEPETSESSQQQRPIINNIYGTVNNLNNGNVTYQAPVTNNNSAAAPAVTPKSAYTDEIVSRAIVALNGDNKPIYEKQLFLGVCKVLVCKCGWTGSIPAICDRINGLPMAESLQVKCDYKNLKSPSALKFASLDYDEWEEYEPRDMEKLVFKKNKAAADALAEELDRQLYLAQNQS
ncbi:MAG: hypothetical protein IJV20_06480 [Prevotella sp.]|nr:hypothetical protein [Prevotella sp.]